MCCPPTVAGLQLGSFQPDLLILDLAMPDLDSLEVCRSLKANPATRHTKILVTLSLFTFASLAPLRQDRDGACPQHPRGRLSILARYLNECIPLQLVFLRGFYGGATQRIIWAVRHHFHRDLA
ncbi:MAG: response regulator [Anaerolineales bacterium]|nr:MAG: response regulator [Anaerolineales bacterium]